MEKLEDQTLVIKSRLRLIAEHLMDLAATKNSKNKALLNQTYKYWIDKDNDYREQLKMREIGDMPITQLQVNNLIEKTQHNNSNAMVEIIKEEFPFLTKTEIDKLIEFIYL
tara:strand:- start:566 stop:898 length:333 start_codon:yes stop_codon:yes gene_type:complete